MELMDIINDYKKKTGISDAELARRLGLARSTTQRWSSGQIRKISAETAEKLSKLVGYNVEPLLKGMDPAAKLPVIGYVKAGYDLFAEENYLGEEEASLDDCRRADYYLKVEGNSMSGIGIMDGSLVLVRTTSVLESGQIGVVLIGDEVTVKRVVYKNRMMILEAASPDVENRYFSPQEIKNLPVKILGQVLSVKTYF